MLEICVADATGLADAIAGGADRIELCAALELGGLTPSAGLIAQAATAAIPVHALLRPRAGDFIHDAVEEAILATDLDQAADAGLAGVVIGASRPDGTLDTALLRRLVAQAETAGARRGRRLSLTLHRAFDLCPDLDVALDQAIALGFDRILTSGGARTALAGQERLAALHARAAGRIRILAGSGVDAAAVPILLGGGADEVHASARVARITDPRLAAFGFAPPELRHTDRATVARLAAAVAETPGLREKHLSNTNI